MTDKELEISIRWYLASKYCDENIPFKDLQLKIQIEGQTVENEYFIKLIRKLIDQEFYVLKGQLKAKVNDFINDFEKGSDNDVN